MKYAVAVKMKKGVMAQMWKADAVVPVTRLLAAAKDDLASFKEGERVTVTGRSKAKGFQGVVKRHGFGGGPKSHGQKDRLRAPGSIGATAPQRVIPGRKMAGRMGFEQVTVKNLEIVEIKPEEKTIAVRGAVPGVRGRVVIVKK